MKKILKSICLFMLAIMMVLALGITAFAADSTVTYRGFKKGFTFKPGSSYSGTDLFDNFKGVMPGDILTETIIINNRSNDSDYIKVYIRAKVHDEKDNPLSHGVAESGETVASMTDFLSQLYMMVYYNGEMIGSASCDELNSFVDPVYLGTINAGHSVSLDVTLAVPTDLGNEYANRVGEVDWEFVIEAFDDPAPPTETHEQLTVRKVWNDDGTGRPESVKVNLLCDGTVDRSVILNSDNQWTYTWDRLDDKYSWSVEEADVPEGYTVSYQTAGSVVTIVNTEEITPSPLPEKLTALTVVKIWSGDEAQIRNRPASVGVTLYNGEEPVETVWLGEWNNWKYTWRQLDGKGNWSVLENIPQGYTPYYSVTGDVVTITNTAILIQTGQLNWPIAVFAILGIIMVFIGFIMLRKEKKRDD